VQNPNPMLLVSKKISVNAGMVGKVEHATNLISTVQLERSRGQKP